MIVDLIKKLVSLIKKEWGTTHSLTMLPSKQFKCKRCNIVYVAWTKEQIMETECLYFRKKLIDLIDRNL